MKLHEHEAKEVFAAAGIPTPRSVLAFDAEAAAAAARTLGFPCVLKSQVLRGGRGKAGLIKVVKSEAEARDTATALLSGPHGVRKLLVEEAVDIEREIYLSITVDPAAAEAVVLACAEGGVEIEELAATAPDKIVRERVPLAEGLLPFRARNVAYALGLEGEAAKKAASVLESLWRVFRANDAELAEINPLFVTKAGALVAGDGKLAVDDNALFRHKDREPGRDYYDSDAAFEAAAEGIPYLQFDGDISLMCAGAGLTTVVYDLIVDEGGSVANYLEFGGPNYKKAVRAMELCLKNDPKVILIVTFGTIARADVMAEGIAEAIGKLKPSCPIVACIRGTGEEKAVELLRAAGLDPLFDTEEAVRRAVALGKAGPKAAAQGGTR
ncbi:MAG: succinate--CoA ligase subunit beta [Spirochaetaceae bacterium]|nr:succinate--CoA ligase subunit beta [Spirochaetaceae bacterium]